MNRQRLWTPAELVLVAALNIARENEALKEKLAEAETNLELAMRLLDDKEIWSKIQIEGSE